ncbi:chitinase [Hydrogenimonas sp.]|nr:chitinase [Hydrogenimonas sp.]
MARIIKPETKEKLQWLIKKGNPLKYLDVSSITDMSLLFFYDRSIDWDDPDNDISGWNVTNVTDMTMMFTETGFNQDISGWDVSKVESMCLMFAYTPFNQDISSWNVSNVTNMNGIFAVTPFNRDISSWNVSKVTDMSLMFKSSSFVKQTDILCWDINPQCNMETFCEIIGITSYGDWASLAEKLHIDHLRQIWQNGGDKSKYEIMLFIRKHKKAFLVRNREIMHTIADMKKQKDAG